MQNSLIDHDKVGHIEGIRQWNGSVWRDGLDANNSDIDKEEADMVGQGGTLCQCKY